MRLIENATTSVVTGEVVQIPRQYRRDTFSPVYVNISANATVTIEGTSDRNLPFAPLDTFTASGMKALVTPSFIRVTVTGNTGVVDVLLDV